MFMIITVTFLVLRYLWKRLCQPQENVEGKIVLITGGARGIGKELAIQYGRQGATVVCVDINQTENEETVQELKHLNIKAHAYTCNAANLKEISELQKTVEKEVGPVSIVIANAGKAHATQLVEDVDEETFREITNLNYLSVVWVLKAFLPDMKKRKTGHIVAISSVTGLSPLSGLSAYSVSKKAVSNIMRAAREESKVTEANIKFTTIYPDFTSTNMCQHLSGGMPLMLTADQVAKATIQAQRQGKTEASIPWHYLPLSKLLSLFPSITGMQINYWVGKLEGIGKQRAWGNIFQQRLETNNLKSTGVNHVDQVLSQ